VRKKQKQTLTVVIFSSLRVQCNALFVRIELYSYNVVIAGGSNNAGVGASPQLPEANGGSEAEPPTLRRFLQFFPQNMRFKAFLVEIYA